MALGAQRRRLLEVLVGTTLDRAARYWEGASPRIPGGSHLGRDGGASDPAKGGMRGIRNHTLHSLCVSSLSIVGRWPGPSR